LRAPGGGAPGRKRRAVARGLLPWTSVDVDPFTTSAEAVMPKYSKKAQDEVKEAMHEMKEGTLTSGGKSKTKVTNPKQAIAIGLSRARKKGAKMPRAKG
jgi:hypothetical protein